MNILLTGGAGYIGSHTAVSLFEAGYTPLILDNFSNSHQAVIGRIEKIVGKNITCIQSDVSDAHFVRNVIQQYSIDAVIHFAALKSVSESVQNPIKYYQNNMKSFLGLIEGMESSNCRRLVFSSSCTVYGNQDKSPVSETAPLGYSSPYGHTKLMAEEILRSLINYDWRWKVGILRYFNPVGAHESGLIGEDQLGAPDNLMPLIAEVASGNREYIQVFGGDYPTKDGTPVRDYIHVVDLAEGHIASLDYLTRKGSHVVNLGTGAGISVLEMLMAYEQASGKNIPYKIVGRRPGDSAMIFGNSAYAQRILGWRASRNLMQMCQSSWKWKSINPMGFKS